MSDEYDHEYFSRFIGELRVIAAREGEPANFRRIAESAADVLDDALAAAERGDHDLVREIIEGTMRPDGKRANDGLVALLPRWARGVEVLEALNGIVVVDEGSQPPSVTVHWELLPRHLRVAAASLASELVDMNQGRPKGGRPRKARESETG